MSSKYYSKYHNRADGCSWRAPPCGCYLLHLPGTGFLSMHDHKSHRSCINVFQQLSHASILLCSLLDPLYTFESVSGCFRKDASRIDRAEFCFKKPENTSLANFCDKILESPSPIYNMQKVMFLKLASSINMIQPLL